MPEKYFSAEEVTHETLYSSNDRDATADVCCDICFFGFVG